jgi:hypothetical protein
MLKTKGIAQWAFSTLPPEDAEKYTGYLQHDLMNTELRTFKNTGSPNDEVQVHVIKASDLLNAELSIDAIPYEVMFHISSFVPALPATWRIGLMSTFASKIETPNGEYEYWVEAVNYPDAVNPATIGVDQYLRRTNGYTLGFNLAREDGNEGDDVINEKLYLYYFDSAVTNAPIGGSKEVTNMENFDARVRMEVLM